MVARLTPSVAAIVETGSPLVCIRRASAAVDLSSGHCQLEQSEGDFRRFASAIHQVACDV